MADNFARVSAVCLRPVPAADSFARVSALGDRPVSVAAIFARVLAVGDRPVSAAARFAFASGVWPAEMAAADGDRPRLGCPWRYRRWRPRESNGSMGAPQPHPHLIDAASTTASWGPLGSFDITSLAMRQGR